MKCVMLLSSLLRRHVHCIGVRSLLVISCLVLVLIILFYVFNTRIIVDPRADTVVVTVEAVPQTTVQPLEVHFVNPLTPRDMKLLNTRIVDPRPRTDTVETVPRTTVQPIEIHFVNPLSSRDMEILNRTFRVFVESVEAANLTYFIYGGTLLGSLRHHSRIPWDDDVDVLMHVNDKPLIEKTLSKLYPDYGINKIATFVWKFYPTVGRYVAHHKHRSPYVDVIFFNENETHVWNISPYFRAIDVWVKQKVFPLHRRPFGDLSVAAPCNGLAVMGSHFNIGVCISRKRSHILETTLTPLTLPCDRLAHLYPFVSSHQMNGSLFVQETLMLGDRQIKNFTALAPC